MLVSFHDLAKIELNEAAQYYERESRGLGEAFVTEVERCTEAIVRYPEAGPVVHGSIRRLVRRFPYALLYRVKPAGHPSPCDDELDAPPRVLGGSVLRLSLPLGRRRGTGRRFETVVNSAAG